MSLSQSPAGKKKSVLPTIIGLIFNVDLVKDMIYK